MNTDSDMSGCSSELFPLIQRQVINLTMTTQKQNSDKKTKKTTKKTPTGPDSLILVRQ